MGKKIRVLFVEDEEISRKKISDILTKENDIDLVTAKNGLEGLELYKEYRPHVIITDINIPELDGLALSRTIKSINNNSKIIILTVQDDSKYLKECIKIKIDAFLTKPIDSEELLENIRALIQNIDLEKKKNKLEKLLDEYKKTVDLSSIVSITDTKGKIKYVNHKFEDISGYTKEELIGKPHNVIRHPDMSKDIFRDLWETIKVAKKPWYGKIKNRRKDGSAYYVDTVINPILDENDEIIEFVAVRTDISEHEERKEFLKKQYQISSEKFDEVTRLSKLYEDAMDKSSIVIRISTDMKINHVNTQFCKLTKYTKDELLGKDYSMLLHPEIDMLYIETIFNKAKKYGIWKGQLKGFTKKGKEIHFTSTILPIKDKDEKIIEYMVVRNDITQITELHTELEETQREIIYRMGEIGETRSQETGYHVKRVAEYSKLLALKSGLAKEEAELIKLASPMHDIGKVGIPDSILNKPARHTVEEFEVMKTHSKIGYELLKNSKREILKASSIIAYEHHEKWDGSGYPRGLKGNEIHIYARITAICDVFDALAHERPYKKAWELDRIIELLKEEKTKHFDPSLVRIFLENLDQFLEIKNKYEDIN